MKIWVDDIRQAPAGYYKTRSVNETKRLIEECEKKYLESHRKDTHYKIQLINLDHDAGDFYEDGGDYIEILKWLEETKRNYMIHIHSMNPVGFQNMMNIVKHNGWVYVQKPEYIKE